MTVSHNDVHLIPIGELTDELMMYDGTDDLSDDNIMTNPSDRTIDLTRKPGANKEIIMEDTGDA